MAEPISAIVAQKVLVYITRKTIDQLVKAFREEIARIHQLIEANTRADLYAALEQTENVATLRDEANRRLHLNLAIAEFNKALHRLEGKSDATPDRLLARFGKVFSYSLLNEPLSARAELRSLNSDLDSFFASVKAVGFAERGFNLFHIPSAIYHTLTQKDEHEKVVEDMLRYYGYEQSALQPVLFDIQRAGRLDWLEWWDLAKNLKTVATELEGQLASETE